MPNTIHIGDFYPDVVLSEEVSRATDTTDKPVEDGSSISDGAINQPTSINVSAVLVGPDASQKLKQLVKYRDDNILVNYVGKEVFLNCLVTGINTEARPENLLGYTLDINLSVPKIAKIKTFKVNVKNPKTGKQDAKTATKVKNTTNIGRTNKRTVKKPSYEDPRKYAVEVSTKGAGVQTYLPY